MAEKYPQRAVGERIRRARKDAGLSQEALADELGASRVSVSSWERGERQPVEFLEPLAKRLGLDPRELRLLGDALAARERVRQDTVEADRLEQELEQYLAGKATRPKRALRIR